MTATEFDQLPVDIQSVLMSHDENECPYEEARRIADELNRLGWRCDFDLEGIVFDVEPM
jgi:hypothetical protein